MQFYLYDIASLDEWDIRDDGQYGNPERIESFWEDGQYERFFIRVDGVIAGFVLTSSKCAADDARTHVMSEFFVLRRYRRAGVGRSVATRLFEKAGGIWEISVMRSNTPAQEFWTSVISGLVGKCRHEIAVSQDTDDDVIFRFSAVCFQDSSSVSS